MVNTKKNMEKYLKETWLGLSVNIIYFYGSFNFSFVVLLIESKLRVLYLSTVLLYYAFVFFKTSCRLSFLYFVLAEIKTKKDLYITILD